MLLRPSITLPLAVVIAAGGGTALALHSSGSKASTGQPSSATVHTSHSATSHVSKRHATNLASRHQIARISGAQSRADAVIRAGRKQYRTETGGSVQRTVARRAAANSALLAALRSGNLAQARSVATSLLYRADHISRIEIVRGGRSLVSVGKGFVVGATGVPLRGGLGTMEASIQDVIGYVRLLHRRTGADVIVRGNANRVESSLPAANGTSLPSRGAVTVAGQRYHVSSFSTTGLLAEPLRVWVLVRG
jgi:hypothetical protein